MPTFTVWIQDPWNSPDARVLFSKQTLKISLSFTDGVSEKCLWALSLLRDVQSNNQQGIDHHLG